MGRHGNLVTGMPRLYKKKVKVSHRRSGCKSFHIPLLSLTFLLGLHMEVLSCGDSYSQSSVPQPRACTT